MKSLFFYTYCILSVSSSFAISSYSQFIPQGDPTYNQQNDSNGREYKAMDSKNTGNKGAGAAAAAGASMLSTGIPMTLSPILPVQIAGWDLVAKGIAELAQAGADKGTANQNANQESMLRNNYDGLQNGMNESAPTANSILNSPAVSQALQNQGIDPNDLLSRIKSNEFSNGADIYNAYKGTESPATDSEISQGLALANQQVNQALQDAYASSGASQNMNENILRSQPKTGLTDDLNSAAKANAEGATALKRGVASVSKTDGHSANAEGSSTNLKDAILGQFNFGGANPIAQQAPELSKEQYHSMGIQSPVVKQNIFFVAHRHFRNFSKWCKDPEKN